MRRVLYVVLILLLPLRAWVGDAMATQMAFPAPVQYATNADASHRVDHAGLPAQAPLLLPATLQAADDCPGHAGHASASDQNDAEHCSTCAMCQTCHTVAVLYPVADPDAGLTKPAAPWHAAHGFTSADRALALKPPTT